MALEDTFLGLTTVAEQAQLPARPSIESILDPTGIHTRLRLWFEPLVLGNRVMEALVALYLPLMCSISFEVRMSPKPHRQGRVQCNGVRQALLFTTAPWANLERWRPHTLFPILSLVVDEGLPTQPSIVSLLLQYPEALKLDKALRCTFFHHPKAQELCSSTMRALRHIIPHDFVLRPAFLNFDKPLLLVQSRTHKTSSELDITITITTTIPAPM